MSIIVVDSSKQRGVLKKLQETNDLNGFPQQDSWRPLHHLTTGNQTQVPQHLLLQLLQILRYTSNLIYSNYITNERKLMKLGPMHRPAFRIPTLSNGMCQSSKTCDKSLRESASQSKAWQFTTNLCPKIFEKGEEFDELVTGDFDCLQYLHSSMMYFISYIWQAQ